jgi:zinc protease
MSSPTAAGGPTRETLDNGLLVIVQERRSADTVAVRLTTRSGSRDDAALPGLAFVTMRAMLAGTVRRPSGAEITRAAAQVGGTFSGSADDETSALFALMPASEADLGFDLVADVATAPLFDPEAFAGRKQLTLQDVARRRSDPSSVVADVFRGALFAGHPLASSPTGTPESLAAMTRDDAVANHDRFWGGSNAVLAIVGRISVPDALAKARHYFGGLAPGTINARPPARAAVPGTARTMRAEAGQQQAQFLVGFPAPSVLDADRYAMIVLNTMTGGPTGRFFVEIRSQRGLAYTAGSGYQNFSDAGAWFAAAGVDPQNVDPALAVVREQIQRLRDEVPDAQEVADTINQIAGGQLLADETNAARAERLGICAILGTPDTAELVRRVREVTPADVQRVAQTYLDLDRATTVIVGPPAAAPAQPPAEDTPATPPEEAGPPPS